MRDPKLSVWNSVELQTQGATLPDLQFGSLEDSGQLCLTDQDYQSIAKSVSMQLKKPLNLRVVKRTQFQDVKEPWWQWRNAHVQVELTTDWLKDFPKEFRKLAIQTAKRKNAIVAPALR